MTAMTASGVRDLVDAWCCAIRLLPSEPRALAALLKSDTPMPSGVRYLIGEIFHHGNPPLIDVTVKSKRTKTLAKSLDKLNAHREYGHRLAGGQSSQDATADIGEQFGVSDRQIYSWLKEGVPAQFNERLTQFTEEINFQNFSDPRRQIAHDDGESANDAIMGAMSMAG